MRYLLPLGLSMLALLAGCAASRSDVDVATTLSTPVDTVVQQQAQAQRRAHDVLHQLTTGKLKFNGPVVFQFGGTGNQAGATDATKAKSPVAAAPGAVATEQTTHAGAPWSVQLAVVLGAAAVGICVGAYLRGKFNLLSFIK